MAEISIAHSQYYDVHRAHNGLLTCCSTSYGKISLHLAILLLFTWRGDALRMLVVLVTHWSSSKTVALYETVFGDGSGHLNVGTLGSILANGIQSMTIRHRRRVTCTPMCAGIFMRNLSGALTTGCLLSGYRISTVDVLKQHPFRWHIAAWASSPGHGSLGAKQALVLWPLPLPAITSD